MEEKLFMRISQLKKKWLVIFCTMGMKRAEVRVGA